MDFPFVRLMTSFAFTSSPIGSFIFIWTWPYSFRCYLNLDCGSRQVLKINLINLKTIRGIWLVRNQGRWARNCPQNTEELIQGRRQRQKRRQKTMIWLVEWRKLIVLHVRHALEYNSLTLSPNHKFSKFKVLTTTWTHNSKSVIRYIYFNNASTTPFTACSVNNKECEEKQLSK